MTSPQPQSAPRPQPQLPIPADLSGLVILDVWAPWCAPCRALNPVLEGLAATGQVRVVKVNVDEHPALCDALRIQAIPTLILAHDGVELARRVGAATLPGMQLWLAEHQQAGS